MVHITKVIWKNIGAWKIYCTVLYGTIHKSYLKKNSVLLLYGTLPNTLCYGAAMSWALRNTGCYGPRLVYPIRRFTWLSLSLSLPPSLSPHAPSDLRVEENICSSYVGIVRKLRVWRWRTENRKSTVRYCTTQITKVTWMKKKSARQKSLIYCTVLYDTKHKCQARKKYQPTDLLTYQPTDLLTYCPTELPTYQPTTLPIYWPTDLPTYRPTYQHTTYQPTLPTYFTNQPTYWNTDLLTYQPTDLPTYNHADLPTYWPTDLSIYRPTNLPPYRPTDLPTYRPTDLPTYRPTDLLT